MAETEVERGRRRTLRHPRLMLLNTITPILEIAVSTGFTTHSHFTKCYRQRFRRVAARRPLEHVGCSRSPDGPRTCLPMDRLMASQPPDPAKGY